MAASSRKQWVYAPPKPKKPPVPDAVKADVASKAHELVESVLKTRHVNPPPDDAQFNYIVDIGTKWYGSSLFFFATYRSPGPTALSPTFEARFARLEYRGADRFGLAFMRHTGQWVEPYADQSLHQCLAAIRDDPWFFP